MRRIWQKGDEKGSDRCGFQSLIGHKKWQLFRRKAFAGLQETGTRIQVFQPV
jgi:hypothetical protein